jgi:hypothetical protein
MFFVLKALGNLYQFQYVFDLLLRVAVMEPVSAEEWLLGSPTL